MVGCWQERVRVKGGGRGRRCCKRKGKRGKKGCYGALSDARGDAGYAGGVGRVRGVGVSSVEEFMSR